MILLGALAAPVWTQDTAQNQQKIAPHDEPVTFSSQVNVVSVPVVVRDRDGKTVGTLRQKDFQLFDKGKPRVVATFSIQRSGQAAVENESGAKAPSDSTQAPAAAQPALPDYYVAYLVDDVHLDAGDLLHTRQNLNRHLDEALQPATRAAIFTTSGQTLADFTQDREHLHKAVNSIQPWNSGVSQYDCPSVSYYLADLLMNKFGYFSLSDAQIAELVTSGSGDSSLIGVVLDAQQCSHLPLNPVPSPREPPPPQPLIVQVRQAVRQALVYGERETSLGLVALNSAIRRLSIVPGSRNLVLASPGFLMTLDDRAGESDVFDRAIRANVTINTIDMRGLFAITPGGDASHGLLGNAVSATHIAEYEAAAATDAANVLAELADATGGTFFHNDNDLKRGFNLIASRPECIYVLGFSPDALKFNGTFHALKVTLKNQSNLTVQARHGYWARKPTIDPVQQTQDQLRDVFFSNQEIPGIPLDLQTSFVKSADEKFDLTVSVHLDVNPLPFKKVDERNTDTLTMIAGLFDASGKNIAATKKVMELRLSDETLAALRNTGIQVKQNFSVATGAYLVHVVVTDSEGQTITAHNSSVQIP